MDRERRLEGIAFAEATAVVELADAVLADLPVTVTRGPTVGLLAVRVEEPFERINFNFTEVTVSEAEVSANGQRGYAMVLGRQPEKALAGAILDAALECAHPASDDIEALLRDALAAEDARLAEEWSRVAPTRVNFEEMAP
jgi:alpha-D-ribose 1-methylphosphonate 5-triphosphate synthase subunit PhnG